jgi:hypothetical protein
VCSTSGGTPPVTHFISAGIFPPGLTLSTTGSVSGVPVVSGANSFTVKTTDSGSPTQVAQLNENVALATGPLVLFCSLSAGKVGSPTSGDHCDATGGKPPYHYFVANGALPAGLTLNGATGTIPGGPTAAGTSSFTLQVTDSCSPIQTATQVESSFIVMPTPRGAFHIWSPVVPMQARCSFIGLRQRLGAVT